MGTENLQYGGLSAGGWPMHQITQQLLLPGIAAALVERQVGATGEQARGIEQAIGLLNRVVPPARPGLTSGQMTLLVSGFKTSRGPAKVTMLIAASTSQALQTVRNRDQNSPSASYGDRQGRQIGIGAKAGRPDWANRL